MSLPHKGRIGVVGLVGALFRHKKAALDDLPYHHFKGLAVSLIEGQKQARKHGEHHNQRRRAGGDAPPKQKEKRDAYQQRTAKTNELPLRQPKHHLGFHAGKILGDSYISHNISPRFFLAAQQLFHRLIVGKALDGVKQPFVVHPPLQVAGNGRGRGLFVNHHIGVKAHAPQGFHAV